MSYTSLTNKKSYEVLFTKQRSDKKKNQRIDTKTCQKKKKTRLKNIKEKGISD